MNKVIGALGIVGLAAGTVLTFLLPPASSGFQSPQFARIMLVHLPCAFSSIITLFAATWFGFKWLRTRAPEWDARSSAAAELCFTFILLTLATGILFSKVQWGDWWHNDPRQTSFLLVALMFGAYFVLRQALTDPDRRATSAAGYLAAMLLPILFLTFVYPRLEQVRQTSLHPTTTVPKWEFSGNYGTVFLLMLLSLLLSAWTLGSRRVSAVKRQLEDANERLDLRGGAPGAPVVRPTAVSPED
jgi:heme exporter protein C